MYDVVIIGAGPAGSTLARLIGDKYKVLLIDKRDLENGNTNNPRSKCCGGLLAPDAQKMMAKLGLGIPKDILVEPQLFAVRTIDLTNNLERLYQRFYINIDREKFDKWLISKVPDTVDKEFNSIFKNFVKSSEGYDVKYIHNRQERIVKTRIIIGADGALSKVRKHITKDKNSPVKYIAIQEWFESSEFIPYYTAIFDQEVSDFYSWIIPKDNHILLGSALKPKGNSWVKYNNLKLKLAEMGFDLNNKIKTEGAHIYRPNKMSQCFIGKDNVALVGEAAGAISPSSAEGISYAFKSSLYLAQSLEEGLDGFLVRYRHKMKGVKLNLIIKNIKSPAMYNPLLRKVAMKSRFQSIE